MTNAQELKAQIHPFDFYRAELPAMPTHRRETGWCDGGLCPFHPDEHTGNFRLNLDSGAYRCFSCGASGGDVLHFVQARYGLDFPEALDYLEEQHT